MKPPHEAVFRRDINGLRALAVAAVVLYHFGLPGSHGGFVGVDVFFAISGFLMTRIILGSLESGAGFSFMRFYAARAIRIIPAMLLLVATVVAIGWLFLPAADYRALGSHALGSLGFVSNMVYWKESGYFDTRSHEKWLLHTWSLSVEWQFYMLLPIVLTAAWRLRPARSTLVALLWSGFVLSLALSVALSSSKPSSAFFLLPTRAWEMLAGGLVFIHSTSFKPTAATMRALNYGGLAVILVSMAAFTPAMVWPGGWALAPVAGAVLVLLGASQNAGWIRAGITQWIGDRSYSLYLWHWPLAVVLTYFGKQGNPSFVIAGLALTVLLGHLSFRWIETPTRQRLSTLDARAGLLTVLAAGLALAAPPAIIVKLAGVPGRIAEPTERVFAETANRNPRWAECHVEGPRDIPGCTYGGPKLGAVVVGDSHAAAVIRSIEKALPSPELHVLDWTLSACPTVAGIKKTPGMLSTNCGQVVSELVARAERLPRGVPIVIANYGSAYVFGRAYINGVLRTAPQVYFDKPQYSVTPALLRAYQNGIVETACRFAKGNPVYLLRPIPEMGVNVPNVMGRAMLLGEQRDVSVDLASYRKRNQAVWDAQDQASRRCGARIIDPTVVLCAGGVCKGSHDGMPLYYDTNHLSERGANRLIPLFKTIFEGERIGHASRVAGVY